MDQVATARRDAVLRLCRAQASGLLSVEAFEERYALIRDAASRAAILAIVADLDGTSGSYDAIPGASASPVDLVPSSLPPIRIPAIFSSANRAGNWNVPEEIALLVVMGEVHLDFRDATFTADTVLITVSLTMGSLKVTVPPGTQVENECREIVSSSKHERRRKDIRGYPPNGLLVVIRGRLLFGELIIRERASEDPTMMERLLGA